MREVQTGVYFGNKRVLRPQSPTSKVLLRASCKIFCGIDCVIVSFGPLPSLLVLYSMSFRSIYGLASLAVGSFAIKVIIRLKYETFCCSRSISYSYGMERYSRQAQNISFIPTFFNVSSPSASGHLDKISTMEFLLPLL